jgi:hypothetical protein
VTYPGLYPLEVDALFHAATLHDDELVDELLTHERLATHGYSNADGLRRLAALSLMLARRLDARAHRANGPRDST